MIVTNVRIENGDGTARLTATVIWEDTRRSPVDIYFEVPSPFAGALVEEGNSFLLACVFPAVEAGEKRIAVDSYVCPRLRAGLETILRLFQQWYGTGPRGIALESASVAYRRRPVPPAAAAFLTCGIDSLATLRRNRLMFQRSHPEFIRDLICLYGINFDSDDSPVTFASAMDVLGSVAKQSDAVLIPLTTNARRELNPDLDFFRYKYHAALLGAAAHALSGRVNTTFIASSHDIPNLIPWGSHPLVDTNLSSADVRIYHDSFDLSRLEKTRLVADWDVGLQNIRVCTANWPGSNCNRCEKCLRTMLGLAALGVLERSRSFEPQFLTEAAVRSIQIFDENQETFYAELIQPLRAVGRRDLAAAVKSILATYRGETGIRGALKELDRRYLGGGLLTLKRSVGRSGTPGEPERRAQF